MKKIHLIAYTMGVLMIGAMIGGAINAWALGTSARIQVGDVVAGIHGYGSNEVRVTIFQPYTVKSISNGTHLISIKVEK